jgi:ammonia channel protein AmtB
LFGFLVTVCFLPLATAWTIAGGFLYQLRLIDEGSLFSLNLVAGASALIGSILIEPRTSKYF